MKNKKGQKLFLCLSILLLTIAATHILFPHLNNWKLSLYGVKNVYTLHEPLSGEALERDFGEKSWFQYAIPAFKPESEIVFIPDRDICYYVSPEDAEPVAILKAGEWYRVTETGIQYAHSSYQYHEGAGIGIRTWPTQNKEWRYAVPPIPHAEEKEIPKYCYIRYSDIQAIVEGDAGKYYKKTYQELTPLPDNDESLKEYLWEFDDLDIRLWKDGSYYSPNLHILIFDTWNLGFLVAGLLLLGVTLFWMHKSRKRDVVSQELVKKIPGKKLA